MRDSFLGIVGVSVAAGMCLAQAPTVATYEVTFEAIWTAESHPQDFPEGPHFSPPNGGTHNADVTFWEPGGIASWGIERMAEAGRVLELQAEIEDAIVSGDAEQTFRTAGTPSPGVRTIVFSVHESHPLATVVTMLAPSPDWFVGVTGVPLLVDGQWVNELVFDLEPWDAGTDAGVTYTSPNEDITPHIPIANMAVEFPFLTGAPVGRMTFTLMFATPGGCSRADLAAPYGSMDFSDVVAFLSAFAANQDEADVAPPFDQWDFTDVTTFLVLFTQGCG